jgi:dTDP-4-amino-4,6-dideoxygalactose transaminase
MLRDYGQREKYHHELQGYNRRLDTIQAAVLKAKLPHLEGWNAARRQHAEMYDKLLSGNGIVTPVKADYATPVYHLYVIRVENRNELKDYLQERGVATGIHYPIPIHLQTAYRCLGYGKGSFPITERYAEQILSLPMYAELTPQLIEQVTEAITEFAIEHKVRHFASELTP